MMAIDFDDNETYDLFMDAFDKALQLSTVENRGRVRQMFRDQMKQTDAAIARAESAERELAECKAAQEWRTGDEIPHEEGWYQTLNWGMYGHLYFSGGRWSKYPVPPALWRPAPPPPQGE